jgi:hypothetical protein
MDARNLTTAVRRALRRGSRRRAVTTFTREDLLAADGVRFCGTQDLARFADGSIDLFVNVASFQR